MSPTEVASLKDAFSTNTNLSEWCTLLVFVGLLGDILVILVFDLFDKDMSWTEIILAGVAALVITVGVYGEYRYGGRATEAANSLQTNSEREVASLNRQAAELNNEAAKARKSEAALQNDNLKLQASLQTVDKDVARASVRIAKLNAEAEAARAQIAKADARAEEASARADEANAKVAESNEKAEAERLARVKLEQTIEWRTLTSEQSKRIIAALKPFAGERANLLVSPYEVDASTLADSLFCVLERCWKDPTTGATDLTAVIFPAWAPWSVVPTRWVAMDSAGWIVGRAPEQTPAFRSWKASANLSGLHGIEVVLLDNATARDVAAAVALLCALREEHFDAGLVTISGIDLRVPWFSDLDSKARIAIFVESRVPPTLTDNTAGPSCGKVTDKAQ